MPMSRYKQFRKMLLKQWRTVIVASILGVGPIVLFGIHLASHSHGILPDEQLYIDYARSSSHLLQSPGFMPYQAAVYSLARLGVEQIVYYRLLSVIIATLAVWSFYYIVQRWYTRRVALIGTVLFSTSSLVLHTARTALPDVLLLGVLMTVATGLWLQQTKKRKTALYVFVLTLALTVYIPGLVWVSAAALAWQGRRLLRVIRRQRPAHRIAVLLLPVIMIAPAITSLVLHPIEILTVMGLPTHLTSVSVYLEYIKHIASGLVWRYQTAPSLWTPGTPVFDAVTIIMIVLGVYSLRFERELRRSRIQLSILGVTLLLILTMGPVSLVAVTPMLYLLATGGFAFMLQQWFTVFPRNPFARVVAVACISFAVLGVGFYHTYRYFTVWPNHPDVRIVLTHDYLIN